MTPLRRYRWYDYLIAGTQQCLHTLQGSLVNQARPHPASNIEESPLTQKEKKLSASLMRINHTGEVCAQALYLGQSITARENNLRETLSKAAQEEIDHLNWCQQRLIELESQTSFLNPIWFGGSLIIGAVAGCVGDRWSLGFLAETEHQVYHHLGSHLEKLPVHDQKSRAIIMQMQQEEAQHAATAQALGAAELPLPIKWGMRWMAKIMTRITYYV